MILARKEYEQDHEPFKYYTIYICAMLYYSHARINLNFLPKLLGLYLYGSGVKRCYLLVLSSYGIYPSYFTITRDMQQLSDIVKKRFPRLL